MVLEVKAKIVKMKNMDKRIMMTLLLLLSYMSVIAIGVNVDGIYYDFDKKTKTASVTFRGKYSHSYLDEYSGEVVIPSSVTYEGIEYSVTQIGQSAFEGCVNLTSVTIPNNVKQISSYAFSGCSNISNVILPSGVAKISDGMFDGCKSLISVVLPEGVTQIGSKAFSECSRLASISIPESVTRIENEAFFGCSSLTNILIPKKVVEIGSSAFERCIGLTSITLPNGVKSVGDFAFRDCIGLTSIILSDSLTQLYCGVFYGCKSLTSIILPDDVNCIGSEVFYKCENLTNITIPDGVKEIGYSAFEGCKNLTNITMPDSLKWIGDYAFYYCSSLTSLTIPEKVIEIGYSAFEGCGNVTNVVLSDSLEWIGDGAFSDCVGLSRIVIPESLIEIGYSVFSNCYRLCEIYNRSGIDNAHITSGASVKNVYTDDTGESKIYNVDDYVFYVDGKDIELLQYLGKETSIVLPLDYEGKKYKIGKYAFAFSDSLASITLSEGVTEIEEYAFCKCMTITSMTIPESVTKIGNNVFMGCSSLASISIPNGVTSIGTSSFSNCTDLISVTLPNGLTSIGNNAFYNCIDLTSITLPESVKYIGDDAFIYCYKLKEVYNKSELDIIAGNVDNGYVAYYAENVYLDEEEESKLHVVDDFVFYVDGDRVELLAYNGKENILQLPLDYEGKKYTIANYAFRNNNSITNVTLLGGVTQIGDWSFSGCGSLTGITCNSTTPPVILSSGTFYDVDKSIPIYVPAESVEAYKSADYWKDFANIQAIVGDDSPILDIDEAKMVIRVINNSIIVDGASQYAIYDISGKKLGMVGSLERGVYIVVADGISRKVVIR